ncbi:MAG: aromatic amino acid lyase, partial [Bacteroidales bacterium]|nr:aromatic amino acid lyase [Bacteroidales bacterium]
MKIFDIDIKHHTFEDVELLFEKDCKLVLGKESVARITKCRDYLDKRMESQVEPIYGVTTGFGSLCNVSVDKENLSQLQKNLVMSHACGLGEEVQEEIVRLMLALKVKSLAYGYSGAQVKTVQRLVDYFNEGVHPVVYKQGSLGASGDLAPLANMCLPLLGLGEVNYQGKRMLASEVNEIFGWEPLTLASKEGLALLNGTQFMLSHAIWSLHHAKKLSLLADQIGAVSLDAFDGRIEPFTDGVHQVRPHKGQIDTARNMRELLEGSELICRPKEHVQDPYSFRCIPQVHGASK